MNGPGDLTVIDASQPQRRSLLKFGGALAFAPLATGLPGATATAQAATGTHDTRSVRWPALTRDALRYTQYEVHVPEEIRVRALRSVERMLAIG